MVTAGEPLSAPGGPAHARELLLAGCAPLPQAELNLCPAAVVIFAAVLSWAVAHRCLRSSGRAVPRPRAPAAGGAGRSGGTGRDPGRVGRGLLCPCRGRRVPVSVDGARPHPERLERPGRRGREEDLDVAEGELRHTLKTSKVVHDHWCRLCPRAKAGGERHRYNMRLAVSFLVEGPAVPVRVRGRSEECVVALPIAPRTIVSKARHHGEPMPVRFQNRPYAAAFAFFAACSASQRASSAACCAVPRRCSSVAAAVWAGMVQNVPRCPQEGKDTFSGTRGWARPAPPRVLRRSLEPEVTGRGGARGFQVVVGSGGGQGMVMKRAVLGTPWALRAKSM